MHPVHALRSAMVLSIAVAAGTLLAMTGTAHAAANHPIFAQTLVERILAMHKEATEIGISVATSHGCRSIASSDPGDVGERCEHGDIAVIRTRKPLAQKESDGFDVTVPLRDAAGDFVGAVGIEFALKPGQTTAGVIAQARAVAKEMASQIHSKANLYRR